MSEISLFDRLAQALRADVPVAVATVVQPLERAGAKMLVFLDGGGEGSLGDQELDERVRADATALLRNGVTELRTYPSGETDERLAVFVESYAPLPRLLIMGSVHAAPALCALAARVGYRVTVIDARATYTTRAPCRSTSCPRRAASCPSTTIVMSTLLAAMAARAHSSSGRPRYGSSCFGWPRRAERPAASTTPAIIAGVPSGAETQVH